MKRRLFVFFIFLGIFCWNSSFVFAQPTWTFNPFGKETKPRQYKDKKLGSEKTATTKFKFLRKFSQNKFSRFNYFFNANNKLNNVIEIAKSQQQDDYTSLLSFYPYSLDNTASQQRDLDSVILKCTSGILLHDLRSDWVDNMYLLIGKAYYFRKQFDSASLTFQFINYNLFPRRKNENGDRIVGRNYDPKLKKISIANKENRNIIDRSFTLPPSRNDALIWLARTYIDLDQFGESAGMINILQDDPFLPKRLKDDLNEVTAYWYYKQNAFDSAAVYLERGITAADAKVDKIRWQFLLAQMYELSGQFDKAGPIYSKVSQKTVNPLMDIYARLNNAKMLRHKGDSKELNNSISKLLKMSRKDKFANYRDIIFHYAGELTLQQPDSNKAVQLFTKSLLDNKSNIVFKNRSHLELGKIAYFQKQYKVAADHYDSLDLSHLPPLEDSLLASERKINLRKVANELLIIEREDSLQAIAMMAPQDRDLLIKRMLKKSNKRDKGNDDAFNSGSLLSSDFNSGSNAGDLFAASSKGEWYFFNETAKSRGLNEFKSKWGKRDNIDNWRRISSINNVANLNGGMLDPMGNLTDTAKAAGIPIENTYDALLANLPLTPEMLDSSNQKVATALYSLAQLFEFDLHDEQQAIYLYEIYLQRFPTKLSDGDIYLGLYHCYSRLGDSEKAAYYKGLLDREFPDSRSYKLVNDPYSLDLLKNNPIISKKYEAIYYEFANGNIDSAYELKRAADSLYGNNYWTPQLLYWEAVYFIKKKQDSNALTSLNTILMMPSADVKLKSKVSTMLEVLTNRGSIENYLAQLNISRLPQDSQLMAPLIKPKEKPKENVINPTGDPQNPNENKLLNPIQSKDSSTNVIVPLDPSVFNWAPAEEHFMVLILNRVDYVYEREAKNAYLRYNQSGTYKNIAIGNDTLQPGISILIFKKFNNADEAFKYFEKARNAAPSLISWINPAKYSFIIISNRNLQLLQKNKDLLNYRKILNDNFPGKF